MAASRPRVVVVGAGIAGSLIGSGVGLRDDIEFTCLERSAITDHLDAGTGLNMGPNAIKALAAIMPERARAIVSQSWPWNRWTIELTSGRRLMDLCLSDVADNPGIRIRWADLYALLRKPLRDVIAYGNELLGGGRDARGLYVEYIDASGAIVTIPDIDLLIAADGRYSSVRAGLVGAEPPNLLGVCLYRVLFPAGPACPIDDYGQWFNGPNRLLAFRVPGDFVYCAGSFPITDEVVRNDMKSAGQLASYYRPDEGAPSPPAGYLIDAVVTHHDQIHWARLQDGTVRYVAAPGALLVGDAAHPMVPTLGQGATQAVEDACVVVDEIRRALDTGAPIADVPERVESRRRARAQFVVDFSREATDTMLAGADPVAGTLRKLETPFVRNLVRLYRDTPVAAA